MKTDIRVIIPAYNEELAIAKVLGEIPENWVSEVIVVDNGSTDQTHSEAKNCGVTVLTEERSGYGQACLRGMLHLKSQPKKPDIIVFLDGDHSDYPEHLPELVQPIISDKADMVLGSRALGKKEAGSMTIPQIFGNWLATRLIRLFFAKKYTDLGPFRAIRYQSLLDLEMNDTNYGWTVEMQLKAIHHKLRTLEIPVNYRQRIGVSKVSGTVKGTFMAGYKIIFTILKYL